MRLTVLSLAIIGTGMVGAAQTASAQSSNSYPWCSINSTDGQQSCYFTSRQQCETTMSGISGTCVPNPNYRQSEPTSRR
jgi:hypothetical protein